VKYLTDVSVKAWVAEGIAAEELEGLQDAVDVGMPQNRLLGSLRCGETEGRRRRSTRRQSLWQSLLNDALGTRVEHVVGCRLTAARPRQSSERSSSASRRSYEVSLTNQNRAWVVSAVLHRMIALESAMEWI
jgi:hypothetical protein